MSSSDRLVSPNSSIEYRHHATCARARRRSYVIHIRSDTSTAVTRKQPPRTVILSSCEPKRIGDRPQQRTTRRVLGRHTGVNGHRQVLPHSLNAARAYRRFVMLTARQTGVRTICDEGREREKPPASSPFSSPRRGNDTESTTASYASAYRMQRRAQ